MLSGNPKSIGIPQVDVLSTGPPDLGFHRDVLGLNGRSFNSKKNWDRVVKSLESSLIVLRLSVGLFM